ncbi:MAG: ankyrin repeat domain-containing protein [Treponema sp.]|nr:ankyrin repeat domain-containing protein [Treponema sp.]
MKKNCVKVFFSGMILLALSLVFSACHKVSPEEIEKQTNLLFDAIADNDADKIKLCVKAGADINRNKDGKGTPLIYAVKNTRVKLETAELLLSLKADVNGKDSLEMSAIHHAVPRGETFLDLLVKAGADINAKDKMGRTPLVFANDPNMYSTNFCINNAKALLARGADINALDNAGYSVLMNALKNRNTESDYINFLISSGAKLDVRAQDGSTALSIVKDDWLGPRYDILTLLTAWGAK